MAFDTLVRGGRVVVPGHGVAEVDLAISGERIAALLEPGTPAESSSTIDASGLYVLPGALDTHTHWGYRGDFATQCRSDSRAAAIGGVTTALLLQRMQPGQFHELRKLAGALSVVDFVFSPAITSEETAGFIEESIEEWGCPSFKFYMAYRNIPGAPPGDDWNQLTDGLMEESLRRIAMYHGALACVHAENAEIVNRAMARVRATGRDGLAAWEEGSPGVAEAEAIQRAALLAGSAGVPLYVVHISGRDALEALRLARARWPVVYGETCPHYLFHNVEASSPAVKFSPPVRYRADSDALWEALRTGLLDCVGSDNSPTLWSAKQGSVWNITRGGPGAGLVLPVVLSEGVNKGRISLERAVEVTSANGARIFGLYPRKGAIQVGSDADLNIVDMDLEKTVTRELFGTWSDYNLYTGVKLKGWPVATLVRGRVVARDGRVRVGPGYGRYIPRRATLRAVADA